jgi:hypothetical protein
VRDQVMAINQDQHFLILSHADKRERTGEGLI